MSQSNQKFAHSIAALQEWQSSICMIPVVVDLLKEKLNHIDEINEMSLKQFQEAIKMYQVLYQSWEKQNLNSRQKEWIHEMADYLDTLQHSSISSRI